MLSQLYIENIAVIEQASIDFDSGFNVLTGETAPVNRLLSTPSRRSAESVFPAT